jgi:hypothetical protein
MRLFVPARLAQAAGILGLGLSLSIAFAFTFAGLSLADENALPRFDSTPGTELYIILPEDGATVSSPVRVLFGLRGMGVAPAGIDMPGTGHHHLVIDAPLPNLDEPVPSNAHYVHFGKGQTETVVNLPPGKHTLQLVLGDMNHVPQKPPVISKQITITVK